MHSLLVSRNLNMRNYKAMFLAILTHYAVVEIVIIIIIIITVIGCVLQSSHFLYIDYMKMLTYTHCVQKKTPTHIFFHISMNDV